MFENPRKGRQARNFTTNVSKILDLKSSSEQIFFRKFFARCPWKVYCIQSFCFNKAVAFYYFFVSVVVVVVVRARQERCDAKQICDDFVRQFDEKRATKTTSAGTHREEHFYWRSLQNAQLIVRSHTNALPSSVFLPSCYVRSLML